MIPVSICFIIEFVLISSCFITSLPSSISLKIDYRPSHWITCFILLLREDNLYDGRELVETQICFYDLLCLLHCHCIIRVRVLFLPCSYLLYFTLIFLATWPGPWTLVGEAVLAEGAWSPACIRLAHLRSPVELQPLEKEELLSNNCHKYSNSHSANLTVSLVCLVENCFKISFFFCFE